jgi:hypothetical protein
VGGTWVSCLVEEWVQAVLILSLPVYPGWIRPTDPATRKTNKPANKRERVSEWGTPPTKNMQWERNMREHIRWKEGWHWIAEGSDWKKVLNRSEMVYEREREIEIEIDRESTCVVERENVYWKMERERERDR